MSTRSLTKVIEIHTHKNEQGKKQKIESVLMNMYRQHDGYLEGHGKELAEFLKDMQIDGLKGNAEKKQIANDAGCLAAQIVAHFKKEPGEIYLFPIDDRDCCQAYEYTVRVDEDSHTIQIEVYGVGQKKTIFKGTPVELLERLGIKQETSLNDTDKENKTTKDWTAPEGLNEQDHKDLKEIKRLYEAGKFKEAYRYACNRDTIIREEIPPDIWKEIGGGLTPSGEEELRKLRQQKKGKSQKRGISK